MLVVAIVLLIGVVLKIRNALPIGLYFGINQLLKSPVGFKGENLRHWKVALMGMAVSYICFCFSGTILPYFQRGKRFRKAKQGGNKSNDYSL